MRLVEFFGSLAEGQKDAKVREFISRTADRIFQTVFDNPMAMAFDERSFIFDSPVLKASSNEYPNFPKNFQIFFHFVSPDEGKQLRPQHRSTRDSTLLVLPVPIDEKARALLALPFAEVAARTLFSRNEGAIREQFVELAHELVHTVDRRRLGWDKWNELGQKANDKYEEIPEWDKLSRDVEAMNDPREMNAYFQDVAAVVAREVRQDPAPLSDVNTFYNYFVERGNEMHSGAFSLWEPQNVAHLKKRVAQLFTDLKRSG